MQKSARLLIMLILLAQCSRLFSQTDQQKPEKERKNIIRYNLSGGLLFGIDKYIVFGYERVVNAHQSFSINIGPASLPKFVTINTDSIHLTKDLKNTGFNLSADYRFYLSKENKYNAPHGLYIGPYFSYNRFTRNNQWNYQQGSNSAQVVTTNTDFQIFTVGGELGYQFILWKRLALDFVLVGPGFSHYDLSAGSDGNLSPESREQLQDALKQLISQKFPGMNYVLSDKHFDANGDIRTWSLGYRYMIHIGFVF
ncbi:MAG TPA: hypothetical protein VG890_10530 [Puia sp.]|nr:hypothetical protein [Puia sp.]